MNVMSPNEWKKGGEGTTFRFGFHPSPFGVAIIIASDQEHTGLAFADEGDERPALKEMKRRWPLAPYVHDQNGTTSLTQRIFDSSQ